MAYETTKSIYERQDSKYKFGPGTFLLGAVLGGLAGLVFGHELSEHKYKSR